MTVFAAAKHSTIKYTTNLEREQPAVQLKQSADSPNDYQLLKEKTVIGTARIATAQNAVTIEELSILPAYRQKGYGSFLLKQLLHQTGGFEKQSLHRAPAPQSAAATALLQKFGFVPAQTGWQRLRVAELAPVSLLQGLLSAQLREGGFFVDATCGNGNDTVFLCRIAGQSGRVLALDIQPEAVQNTTARLQKAGYAERATVVQANHADLAQLAPPESADCVVFNFGYLPGADHALFSAPDTSLPALWAALEILKPGGMLALCLYSGGANGTAEREAILAWLKALPINRYNCIVCRYENWANTAPLPCLVQKKW